MANQQLPVSPTGTGHPLSPTGRDPISTLKEIAERDNKYLKAGEPRIIFKTPDAKMQNGEWVAICEYFNPGMNKLYRGEGRSLVIKKDAAREACRAVLEEYNDDMNMAHTVNKMANIAISAPPAPTPEVPAAFLTPPATPQATSSSGVVSNRASPPVAENLSPLAMGNASPKTLPAKLSNSVHAPNSDPALLTPPEYGQPGSSLVRVLHSIYFYPEASLGHGGMGFVYKGHFGLRECAVKQIGKHLHAKKLEQEVIILQQLNHENIVGYLHCETNYANNIFIAMELGGDNLATVIVKKSYISSDQLRQYMAHTGAGLSYLHKSKVVHRDLKPCNIIIFNGVTAKIADFGISRIVDSITQGGDTTNIMGTNGWMPPEMHTLQGRYHGPGDIFAFGLIIFYTMSTNNCHAFEENSAEKSPSKVLENNIQDVNKLPNWDNLIESEYSVSLRNLLAPILSKQPEHRPKIDVILEHPFFWSAKKYKEFITNVSNELKTARKKVRNALDAEYDSLSMKEFNRHVNWKMQLCPTVRTHLLENSTHPKIYDAGSLISLVEFIRDKDQHKQEWNQQNQNSDVGIELRNLFGNGDQSYMTYFERRIQEFVPFLYVTLQKKEFQKVLVQVKEEFYKINVDSAF